ncbi:MAG: hypothetical protein CMN32_08740 [Saprospirales bacterium]|nr:hypothetical protein [Saprospirales bacterium]
MARYLLKRLLLFVPTLFVVSLVAFFLSRSAPGDPVLQYLTNDPFGTLSSPADLYNAERVCRQTASLLGRDKPLFYFGLRPKSYPDTLYKVTIGFRRKALEQLIEQYGNWPLIQEYYDKVRAMDLALLSLPDSLSAAAASIKPTLRELYTITTEPAVKSRLDKLEGELAARPSLQARLSEDFQSLRNAHARMQAEADHDARWVPAFHWHGLDNQYHHWLSGFLSGDFGISLYERMPVARKVLPALRWTLVLNILALALAFGLSIPIGVLSATRKGKAFDRASSLVLFMLYSLPAFWVGTLLLVFFATPTYGMKLFAGPGLGAVQTGAGFWEQLGVALPHLILPVLCIAYPALAFISRQVRGSMVEALKQDFVRTARAKGLPERTVVWRHAFRNALFPIITMFASVFPASIAGSVAIEFIFNIPGMGWLTLQAILQQDWPVVFVVLMLGAVLTVIGILVADLLYALADPRVKLGKGL